MYLSPHQLSSSVANALPLLSFSFRAVTCPLIARLCFALSCLDRNHFRPCSQRHRHDHQRQRPFPLLLSPWCQCRICAASAPPPPAAGETPIVSPTSSSLSSAPASSSSSSSLSSSLGSWSTLVDARRNFPVLPVGELGSKNKGDVPDNVVRGSNHGWVIVHGIGDAEQVILCRVPSQLPRQHVPVHVVKLLARRSHFFVINARSGITAVIPVPLIQRDSCAIP